MGAFFDKTFILVNGAFYFQSRLTKAAKSIGYAICGEGKGVPVRLNADLENAEWIMLDSPLLKEGSAIRDRFEKALSREFKAPLLRVSCFDSDYAVCKLIDGVNEKESSGFINRPYDGAEFAPADAAAWAAASKKKWKNKAEQFEEVFSGKYVFAEDGLEKLYELLRISPLLSAADEADVDELFADELWIIPEAEYESAPCLPTLDERLAAYMEDEFAERLTGLGYKRFGGSPLRWHKVFGEEGKELISSIVLAVKSGWLINIFFGAQPVCCPLVLSNKYYPLHDHFTYLYDAFFEYDWEKGELPRFKDLPEADTFHFMVEPEHTLPYLDGLVIDLLEKVKDIETLREFEKGSREYESNTNDQYYSFAFAYRAFVEALLADDEAAASVWAEKAYKKYSEKQSDYPEEPKGVDAQELKALPRIFLEKGREACLAELEKVRDSNMKRLKRGGIV
jgi:hypothetical protein